MPAMPTEKSSILAESNFSDLRMKDNLGIKREMDSSTTTGRTTTASSTTTTTNAATARLTNNSKSETDNRDAESEETNKSNKIRGVNDFRFGISIGEGSFSTVYLAKDIHTKREYASEYQRHTNYFSGFSTLV